MNKKVIATLGILVGASAAVAGTQLVSLTGSSTFTVTPAQRGSQIKKIETRFYEDSYESQHVYKVVSQIIYQTGLDGAEEKSVIEAYGTSKSLFDTKAWVLKIAGTDFKIFNKDFVQTTEDDDDLTLNHIISVHAGRELLTGFNDTMVSLEVPNSKLPNRYFAQISDPKAPQTLSGRQYTGTIGYFDAQKLKGIARIYAQLTPGLGANLDLPKPILSGKDRQQSATVTLWNSDGSNDAQKAFSGVGFGGDVYIGAQPDRFSVVLDGDQLSQSRSTATSNLTLVIQNY